MSDQAARERPILFSGPMVRAILAGKKTQTRRIMKPQPQPNGGKGLHPVAPYRTPCGDWAWVLAATGIGGGDTFSCPYGKPGERLWVRETIEERMEHANFYYAADNRGVGETVYRLLNQRPHPRRRVIPSIHMLRAASRITLEITGIRVERLQAISEDDAQAEGVEPIWMVAGEHPEPSGQWTEDHAANYGEAYARLWDKINGPGAWEQNPWVWVVEFKRADQQSAQPKAA